MKLYGKGWCHLTESSEVLGETFDKMLVPKAVTLKCHYGPECTVSSSA